MEKLNQDWANLEALPLSLILDNLEERIDHVWFGAVCKNWQSVAKLNHQNHQFKTNTLPMLLKPSAKFLTKSERLYGIPNNRYYPFPQIRQLCHSNPKLRVCGSSYGWLALVDNHYTSTITLVNPFKNIRHIILPPLHLVYTYKVTLSADPIKCPDDYIIVAVYNKSDLGDIAFIRGGQTCWTYVGTSYPCFVDVIFYQGLLIALTLYSDIVSFHFGCSNDHLDMKTITSNLVLEYSFHRGRLYLVKSLEEELWVVREEPGSYHVFNMQLDVKTKKFEKINKLKSLGDNILFLGNGDSISVSASYFFKSLQSNSIYFSNFDIYNMKSEKTFVSPTGGQDNSSVWILPNFQWN